LNPAIAAFSEKLAGYPREDRERILAAAEFAAGRNPPAITGQQTAFPAGEPFLHGLQTAAILIELRADAGTAASALLQDCYPEAKESIEKQFGKMPLVEDAVKLNRIVSKGKSAKEAENVRKMLFAAARDIRSILIKLAGALHTMRTLDFFPPDERKNLVQEGLDVYAPLAGRLGISWIKAELEDLALKYLNRDAYLQIKEIVSLKRGERGKFLDFVQELIKKEALAAGIPVQTESRAKHFYSIYQKMRKRNKSPGELFDLFGLRLLCPGMENCYTLLGIIHRLWKPVDGRFKDYIAAPKPNGYQSLHTTVVVEQSPNAEPLMLEIQIRTFEMHRTAEYGVAGHWIYKLGKAAGPSGRKRSPLTRPPPRGEAPPVGAAPPAGTAGPPSVDENNNGFFFEDIQKDILKNSILVFTPRGKIIDLPAGSTPLDFAYHIHSAVGEHCLAAKADGAVIPLKTELKSTQVVEIITSSSAHPHQNWLNVVKTAKARSKIRNWLLEHEEAGKASSKTKETRQSADRQGPDRQNAEKQETEKADAETDFVFRAGPGGDFPHGRGSPVFKVKVGGEKNMLIHFAGCCNPILGDPIVGYVSRGRGIIIHCQNCVNLAAIPDFGERRVETQWENALFPVRRFKVEARKKGALFSEIEGAVRKFQGRLIEGKLEEISENHLTGYFTVQLESPEDAARVLRHIRGIPAVFNIQNLE
jgi:GTP pyrophosphokinase